MSDELMTQQQAASRAVSWAATAEIRMAAGDFEEAADSRDMARTWAAVAGQLEFISAAPAAPTWSRVNGEFVRSDEVPPGVIKVPGDLSEADAARIHAKWRSHIDEDHRPYPAGDTAPYASEAQP